MNNSKKILIIIIIVIVIIIAIIIGLLLKLKNGNYIELGTSETIKEVTEVPQNDLKMLNNPSTFYAISNIIQKYLENCDINAETRTGKTAEEKKETLANMLNKNYLRKNTVDSVINDGEYEQSFYPLAMTEEIEDNIVIYTVHGIIEDSENEKYIKDAYYIVRHDTETNGFDLEEATNVNSLEEINPSKTTTSIKLNDDNNFQVTIMNVANLVNRYLANYKYMALNYPERAYEYFDKEYRNKRFGSLEEFKKYVNENKEKILNIVLDQFQPTDEEEARRFVCIDTNGNYYIFYETATMQYTMMLDTYTIDIPEFIEKYENVKPKEKVILNLNRFREALNDKSYKYAYSLLADSFKQRNFPTLESFENYAKENFFDSNEFSYGTFGNEGDTYYTYEVKILDKVNMRSKFKNKNIYNEA